MRRHSRWTFICLLSAGLLLAGCAEGEVAAGVPDAVTVEEIDGSELKLVTLIERSAERLGIETSPITDEVVAGARRTVLPYAALLYDEQGATWTFTNPQGLAFVRASVTVDFIEGDLAILSDGPPAGTLVVTVGGAELYGAETGVGGH